MPHKPPRHIVWSTDTVDLSDPFQRRWYLRQALLHGRAEDVRSLDLDEVARQLGDLNCPSTWRTSGGRFRRGEAMLQGKGILTSIQREALALFATLPDQERFYLTGGTALACRNAQIL